MRLDVMRLDVMRLDVMRLDVIPPDVMAANILPVLTALPEWRLQCSPRPSLQVRDAEFCNHID
jgi:hypothetical protein